MDNNMYYIKGTPRHQLNLFEANLDDIIPEDNPVRFIDAYINNLNIEKLGFKIPKLRTGKPPYDPKMLLKLYTYGYLNKIRSSRKLENETHRNNELIWLTEALKPDFKTIADFRKDNKKGIKNIFNEFLKLCHKLELLSFKLSAIDGTKMRAQNHLGNIYKRENIEKVEKKIQEKIDNYIKELDENDEKDKDDFNFLSNNILKQIKKLEKSKEKIEVIKQIFEENEELEIYFGNDRDSRFQNDNGRINPGYNCQNGVDDKNKLIIANDVTNENFDSHQLTNMKDKISQTKKDLGIECNTKLVQDSGYHDENEIMKAKEDEDFDIYVTHQRDSKTKEKQGKEKKDKIPGKGYEKDNFFYCKDKDIFTCPEGKELHRRGNGSIKRGIRIYKYKCNDCVDCKQKELCTKSKTGRTIDASENTKEMMEFREKCNTSYGKALLRTRKEIVEHPFGTIKRNWGYRYFMQTGLEKVKSEFSFIAYIYNLRRVLNIVPMEELMESI